MDYWLCVSVGLCVSVLSRERHNVRMLRASLSEKSSSISCLPLNSLIQMLWNRCVCVSLCYDTQGAPPSAEALYKMQEIHMWILILVPHALPSTHTHNHPSPYKLRTFLVQWIQSPPPHSTRLRRNKVCYGSMMHI